VRDEVVIAGKRYPDAQVAQQRINSGQITVSSPHSNTSLEPLIVPYGLGDGERDSILLAGHATMKDATLVIDDHLAYLVSDRLGQQKRFLLDIITDLVETEKLERKLAINIVQSVHTRYPPAFVEHTLLLLRR
jgi:hypothetical protein